MHLATYIMMPFMAGNSLAAPAPVPSSGGSSSSGMNTSPQNPQNAGNQQLINSLEQAATSVDRLKLLPNDADHVYDFNVRFVPGLNSSSTWLTFLSLRTHRMQTPSPTATVATPSKPTAKTSPR